MKAYITFCNTANYLEGLMATWLCLRDTGTTIPFYAMLPTKLIQECPNEVSNLKKEGIISLNMNILLLFHKS